MNVKILASGSKGNCTWIGNGEVSILIDVGLAKTKIEKVMLEHDINPATIDAIFLSHEHGDHISGLSLADKYKIPVYASEGTLKDKHVNRLEGGNILRIGKWVGFDALRPTLVTVSPFAVFHDAIEPFGYTLQSIDTKVSVLMDTGCVTADMLTAMKGSDVYVFECNHDEDMLADGPYDPKTKSRILSDIGHLSNQAAADALAKLVKGRGERIYLTHMSSNNNLPKLAEMTVKKALRERGFTVGKHYEIEVV